MKKLLLVGVAAGAVFGAKKLREGVQQNGGLRAARREAKRKARQLAQFAEPKVQQATAAAVAKANELLRKGHVAPADHNQMATKPTN